MTAADFFPPDPAAELEAFRAASAHCRGCPLFEHATQTVFGEGAVDADVVLVGEQPGDQEDRLGEPFVGPAGRLLDRALDEAEIDRARTYITNVVKHFKWRPAGKRRLHQKPNAEEIAACRPWLDAELDRVHPRVVVCLGATAAQALLGRSFRVTQQRGRFVEWDREPLVLATVHPSSILRAQDDETRHREFAAFVDDLRVAAGVVGFATQSGGRERRARR